MAKLKRWSDKDRNYCVDEADASMKCLSKSGYNRDACAAYFESYKACKKEWNEIKSERRKKGLVANPPPEELQELKRQSVLRKKAQMNSGENSGTKRTESS